MNYVNIYVCTLNTYMYKTICITPDDGELFMLQSHDPYSLGLKLIPNISDKSSCQQPFYHHIFYLRYLTISNHPELHNNLSLLFFIFHQCCSDSTTNAFCSCMVPIQKSTACI